MTIISQSRKVSVLHAREMVVLDSTISLTRDNVLRVTSAVGFGTHGMFARSIRVPFSGVELVEVARALNAHEESIYELIDMLEQGLLQAKMAGRYFRTHGHVNDFPLFNKVLAEESPVMVHGLAKGRYFTLTIYAENLKPFTFQMDLRNEERGDTFEARVNEVADSFRTHLQAIRDMNVNALLASVAENIATNQYRTTVSPNTGIN